MGQIYETHFIWTRAKKFQVSVWLEAYWAAEAAQYAADIALGIVLLAFLACIPYLCGIVPKNDINNY